MTDWDEHLGKIDRRTKTARRITSHIVLFLLVTVGLWTFVPMVWKESPPPIVQESRAAEGSIFYDNVTDNCIVITSSGTGGDAIQICADAGGIDIDISGVEGIDISFDGITNGDEIIIEDSK